MAEYIERDMFLKIISHKPSSPTTEREDRLINGFISAVKNCPAADVRPVVRATWQSWEQDKPPCKWYSCDYCGFHALSKSNFCPNCGAKMEES